jgi:hypothetical protein
MHDHNRPVHVDGHGDGMLSIPQLLRLHARQRGGRVDGAGAQPGPGNQVRVQPDSTVDMP